MSSTAIVPTNGTADLIERVVVAGDLSKLSPAERVGYYRATCESLGLNPLTKPFEYITLNNRLTLYATRNCTDQLRARQHVSVRIVSRERLDDIYVVAAQATLPDGRFDESIGAVNIKGLSGDNLANAFMKAETKAKRRATLSIVGLSFADETEIETIPNARPVAVNTQTGEIIDSPPVPSSNTPINNEIASTKQIGMIKGMTRRWQWNEEDVVSFAAERGIEMISIDTIGKRAASDLITALKEAEAEAATAPPTQAESDEDLAF